MKLLKTIFKLVAIVSTALVAMVTSAPIGNSAGAQAISQAWVNNLYCGKPVCDPELTNLTAPAFITNFSKPIGKFSSDMIARLIVNKNNNHINLPPELTLLSRVYNFKERPVFGIIAKDVHGTLWIAFRGTDNIIEFIEDALYWQTTKSIPWTHPWTNDEEQQKILVHAGFNLVYNKFKHDIFDTVSTDSFSNIIVTGYSLGGAVATLLGLDLKLKFNKSVSVYTFASPMVGNKDFAELVDKTIPVYRYINTCDIVHTLPNSVSPNFINPNKPFMYQHSGTPISFTDNWSSLSMNHYISVYSKNAG